MPVYQLPESDPSRQKLELKLKEMSKDTTIRLTVIGDCGPHASVKEWQDCPACERSLRRALEQ